MTTEEATPTPAPPPTETPAPVAERERRRGGIALPVVLLLLLALAAALGWLWWHTQQQLENLRREVAQQLRTQHDETQAATVIARETQEALRQLQQATAGLEVKVLDAQNQQEALESIYQEISRNRDDWLLAEAEQTLSIAAQQLQLAGNVPAALTALQTVDARLARPDRPQFLPIRKVLARDIQRLQAAPTLDVTDLTLRLDELIERIDGMPLAVEAHLREPAQAGTPPEQGSWWKNAVHSAWSELKQLVRIERLDARDPSLLAPEQRYFLRENLKLRLMHARLALLQRDEQAFRNDVRASIDWLKRYFDGRDQNVAGALRALEEMRESAVAVELPSIADSLNAVRSFKLPQEKTP